MPEIEVSGAVVVFGRAGDGGLEEASMVRGPPYPSSLHPPRREAWMSYHPPSLLAPSTTDLVSGPLHLRTERLKLHYPVPI